MFEDIDPAPQEQRELPLGGDLEEYRWLFRSAVKRVTVKELAYTLNVQPETVQNQIRFWNRRKHPSADASWKLLRHDEQHAREVMGRLGWQLVRPAKLTADEGLRALAERAAKGYVSAQEVAQVMAQTRLANEAPVSDAPPSLRRTP